MTKRELQDRLAAKGKVLGERRSYSTTQMRSWVNEFHAVEREAFYSDDPHGEWGGTLLGSVPTGGKPNWKAMAEIAGV